VREIYQGIYFLDKGNRQYRLSPIGIAFLKKGKPFMRGIEERQVPLQGDRQYKLSPLGVASVRGIEEGQVPLQGDRQ